MAMRPAMEQLERQRQNHEAIKMVGDYENGKMTPVASRLKPPDPAARLSDLRGESDLVN
ncbi:MAG: hypothetical protein HKM24_05690 [Gammaproteobacteria bacterium]|nr:hypothetical protein [Gammaproteobacteria bacterium]